MDSKVTYRKMHMKSTPEAIMKLKLERTHPHEINAKSADRFSLWESPYDVSKQNLTIEDPNGLKVITMIWNH